MPAGPAKSIGGWPTIFILMPFRRFFFLPYFFHLRVPQRVPRRIPSSYYITTPGRMRANAWPILFFLITYFRKTGIARGSWRPLFRFPFERPVAICRNMP
jgi:hypothetical protein